MKTRQIELSFLSELKRQDLTFSDMKPHHKIGLGFSGGADSMLLLVLCEKFLPKNSFDVIYFAHGDNPLVDNDRVAIAFCRKAAQKLGLNLQVVELNLEKTQAGWEGAGHNARKEYIMRHYDTYFLGHHLDDKCENYFIQFMRGAGSAKILKNETILKRPLLQFTKNEIKSYLKEKNIVWLEDATNENTDITRNFWRQKVLPQIETHYPQYRERVATGIKAEEQNLALIKDLAQVDGLDELLTQHTLKLDLSLPPRRIQNLIYFYCKANQINTQQATLEELVRQMLRPQKEIQKEAFGLSFYFSKNKKENELTLYISPLPKMAEAAKFKF